MLPHRATSVQPLGTLQLHPYVHLALLLLGILGVYRLLTLPFLPTIVYGLAFWGSILGGTIVYGWLIANRHWIQKRWGSLNIWALELWTIVVLGMLWGWAGDILNPKLPSIHILMGNDQEALILGVKEFGFAIGLISLWGYPWLLDWIFKKNWHLQPFDPKYLERHSPEAAKLLRQFFHQQRGLPLPSLGIVPSSVPIVFGYGFLTGGHRILMSQGLLDRLEADEIASLYALELGYAQERSAWILPWLVAGLQVPYGIYWFLGTGGDRLAAYASTLDRSPRSWVFPLKKGGLALTVYLLGLGSNLGYGSFKCLRFLLLPLARQRCDYGDRWAAAMTGNPNGYSRALVKLAQAQTADLQARGSTHPWLESWELLLPLGYTAAATLSQACAYLPLAQALAWDAQSPFRYWLSLNNAHPPTGDRLRQLQSYAQRWNLTPEVIFNDPELTLPLSVPGLWRSAPSSKLSSNSSSGWSLSLWTAWWKLCCQALPYIGWLGGLGLGLSLWFLSAIGNTWGLWQLAWVLGNSHILTSCLPLGVGLGILLRNNFFFPNLPKRLEALDAALLQNLGEPEGLPLDPIAVESNGILLGRSGIKNWLSQDLWLKTSQGILRLHYTGVLGGVTAFWPMAPRPAAWIKQSVRVSGWLRRGATLWLNLIHLDHGNGIRIQSFPGTATVLLAGCLFLWSYSLFLKI